MLVIDASAYPHIVEEILSDPVAWCAARTLNRYWRDTVDEAMSVVTVFFTDHSSLHTTPTSRLPQLELPCAFDKTLAGCLDRLGRPPPILRLDVVSYTLPSLYRTRLFKILGKVHTTYLLNASVGWTHPCATLITHNQVPEYRYLPRGVRKLVILKNDGDAPYPVLHGALNDSFPRSVSQFTVSFHGCDAGLVQFTRHFEETFLIQLAEVLISGRILDIVDLVAAGSAHTEDWFIGKVRPQVEAQLNDPPLPAPLVTEPIDEVMGRLKFFDLDSYRQLNPGEI